MWVICEDVVASVGPLRFVVVLWRGVLVFVVRYFVVISVNVVLAALVLLALIEVHVVRLGVDDEQLRDGLVDDCVEDWF